MSENDCGISEGASSGEEEGLEEYEGQMLPSWLVKSLQDKKVVNIEEHMPHMVREVICVKCGGGRAIACFPEQTLLKDLECGGCGKTGGVIATGQSLEK